MTKNVKKARADLMEIYLAALAAVDGRRSVFRALDGVEVSGPVYLVAIGKAAASMYRGAVDALGTNIANALVITKEGHGDELVTVENCTLIESGHPWPTEASLEAGQVLLQFLESAPQDARFLFLISGGASSLVEVLPDGMTLDELRRINNWLLGSGLDIHAMNHVRKAVSCIKGGRLARYLDGRRALALLISDVPGDEPTTIGSGLLVAEIPPETELPLDLPDWIEVYMAKGPAMPLPHDDCFASIDVEIVACLDDAKHAAAAKGRELGYEVFEDASVIRGEAVAVGRRLVSELLESAPGLYIWGGETTVSLPEYPGRGGRNQAVALAAAIELEDLGDVLFLAAGTDGTDGPTEDAGALVDGGTVGRGEAEGLDVEASLIAADSGSFLAEAGDLIYTGPTGTNVMDLMLGLKMGSE